MQNRTETAAHIVFFLTQDLQSPSGLGRYLPWAKYLVREGYRVTILALHSNFDSLSEREFINDGVQVRYVAQMHVRKANNKTEYFSPLSLIKVSLEATRALFQAGSREDADMLLIAKPHPMNSIAGLWVSRKKRLPVILDCDDYEAESNHTSSSWQKAILRFFENSMPKKVDLVTTNTYFNKNRMVKLGIPEEKIHYIPNGVDTERFWEVPAETVAQKKTELGLKDKKVIAYLGSLSLANHPVDFLFKAFAEIAQKHDEARLLIVGGGKDLDTLKSLSVELGIGEKTIFTGRVRPDEMNLYYQLADVSIDPANHTLADCGRCPLKIFESWQMGVPVVSSDVGDRTILAGEPPAILLAKSNDPRELSRLLLDLISDEEKLLAMRNQGYERIQQYYWEGITRRSLEIFNKLIHRKTDEHG